jgi:hypothetical protein
LGYPLILVFKNGIKVWGIIFGSPSFTLSFLQKALNKDVYIYKGMVGEVMGHSSGFWDLL